MLLDLLAGTKVLLVQPRTDISRDDHVKIIHTKMEHYAEKLRYDNGTVDFSLVPRRSLSLGMEVWARYGFAPSSPGEA